jgi:hypothetical protein
MKLDTDLFPVGMVELMDKKILVCMDQAETTKGKNVVVPNNPKIIVWKENEMQKPAKRIKPTSAMLIEKYQWQLEEDRKYRVIRGIKCNTHFLQE